MIINIGVSFSFLIVLFILIICFFSKMRITKYENTVFIWLIFLTTAGLSIETFIYIVTIYFRQEFSFLLKPLVLLLFIYYLIWMYLFVSYNLFLLNNKIKNKKNNFYIIIIYILFLLMTIFLPFKLDITDLYFYPVGFGTYAQYVFVSIGFTIVIINSLNNIKKLMNKEFIPLIVCMLLGLGTSTLQFFRHEFMFIVPSHAIAVILMFFTIENPDMKILKELEKSNELLETEMEEKSNLMFKISQDVRVPLKRLEELSSNMINEKSVKTLVKDSKIINSETKGVSFIVNNLLDISNMNINNIKLYKTKVNINTLLKEISLMFNDKDFKYSTLNNIPDIYLDNVRIKQILVSLINYSFNNKSNNCYLEISGILRYDMCRLLITITSNNKLDIKYINEIMNSKDIENIDTDSVNLDLISIKSLISMLNGSFNIKSSDNSTYSIIIDTELVTKENKYNLKNKKVLLIDDDRNELNEYRDILKSLDINVNTSMFLSDIENRIDTINDYDLILIDDEMQPYNAVKIMEYKEKYNIDSKIVIMLGINKEFIKDKYIKDYKFDNYILKREYTKELKKIVDKYL